MIRQDDKDVEYRIFTYTDQRNDWTVRAVVNPATDEFAIHTDIGMLEFSLIEFITDDFPMFRDMVEKRLPAVIKDYYDDPPRHFGVIYQSKGLAGEDWSTLLPDTHGTMSCIIKPDRAVRIINGSYMVVAYYDAATHSGLSIMYNILRDDFFAEQRVYNFPNLVHDFDSKDVQDLKKALSARLVPVLDHIIDEVRCHG